MNLLQHRPFGGHAYRVEPDQRHPVHPLIGEAYELRVLAAAHVVAVTAEMTDIDGLRRHPLVEALVDDLYDPGTDAEGHLMSASRALPEMADRRLWRIAMPSAPAGRIRYRFLPELAAGHAAPTEWFECSTCRWQPEGGELAVIGDTGRLLTDRTRWLAGGDGPVRVRFALALTPSDHVLGFGERFDHLDQRGESFDAVVFEQYQQQGKRTYLPSPFAIVANGHSAQGWGFHVRTSRRTWFDVANTDTDVMWIEAALDPANPRLELRIYDGAPGAVLSAHLDEIGAPTLPPDWVFRPWMSANEWNSQERIVQEVQRSLDLDIPVGVIVIEAWSDESTFTVFRDTQHDTKPDGAPLRLADMHFPADGAWPDPVAMVTWLHEHDVRVLLWQIPLVPIDRGDSGQVAADAATMIERDYCVRTGDGDPYHNRGWWFPGALLPDWTNSEARKWWIDKRRYLLTDIGIDGFKTDGGEHAWGDDLRYADGTRGDETNNLSPLHYAQAYHELIRETGVDGTTFSRSGFTGAATAPCHWAGDEASTWEAFRASITAGLTAGTSGVLFWGWDLAGFSGEIPTVDLYLRSTAMAALCPIMQFHSEFNHGRLPLQDRTPWNIAERTGDERALAIYRHFAHLRQRLQPYLSSQAARSVDNGWPMMRPLCFDHPDDPNIWNHPFQYHLGDHLLVAPICDPGTDTIDVYLPAGEWIDAWTSTRHRGPVMIHRQTPWDEIAVYIRAEAAEQLLDVFAGPATGARELREHDHSPVP